MIKVKKILFKYLLRAKYDADSKNINIYKFLLSYFANIIDLLIK